MPETILYSGPQVGENAVLYILGRDKLMRSFSIGNYAKIGRLTSESTVDIGLDSPIVSRNHGEFTRVEDQYYYRDLNSFNGTFINGIRVGKNAETDTVLLSHGDVLRIDRSDLHESHPDAVLLLFCLKNDNTVWRETRITNDTGDILIGRESLESHGIQIDENTVSRKHATFLRGLNGWSVMDHESTNGVFLNNTRIDHPVQLYPLDVVRILDYFFIFLEDRILLNAPKSQEAFLKVRIRERSVRDRQKKKVILKDVNLTLIPGEMLLILGGSGAGKTTFMNAVMGYEKADGTILYGDTDVYHDYSRMKYQIGFVPQQDQLRLEDTVIATLDNAARMKMPSGTSTDQRRSRVEEVLDLLGLQREQNSLVKKLSGGQKKRLSIAIEYISDPSLFFLDEPDSGLDGIMAVNLMENLRVIADTGKIVMIITHAPDRVAHYFDKILVLAKSNDTNSGQMAFFGTIEAAKSFFDSDTLEGIVRRINRPDEGGDGLADYYIEKYKSMMSEV